MVALKGVLVDVPTINVGQTKGAVMNKKRRKLTLSTETLRTLDEPSLREVAGATLAETNCTGACSACTMACTNCTGACTGCTVGCSICCL